MGKAWLHGCVVTQLEKGREIAKRYEHGFTNHVIITVRQSSVNSTKILNSFV